jgi:hypothetical protein
MRDQGRQDHTGKIVNIERISPITKIRSHTVKSLLLAKRRKKEKSSKREKREIMEERETIERVEIKKTSSQEGEIVMTMESLLLSRKMREPPSRTS